jgi:ankyrin repeat protein
MASAGTGSGVVQTYCSLYRHKLSGMDMTLCDYDGRTALHLAATEGHLECVTFLLEHCNVPYNTKDRSVPEHISVTSSAMAQVKVKVKLSP